MVPTFALFSCACASGLWSNDIGDWAFVMGQLALARIHALTIAASCDSLRDVRVVLTTYGVVALAAAGVGIFQYASGQSRATGLQDDWDIYALTEVLAIPILVSLSSHAEPTVSGSSASRCFLLAVLASGSRGGLAAVAGVFIGLAWMYQRRTQAKRYGLWVVVGLSLVIVGWIAMATNPRLNPAVIAADRGSGRYDIWFVALQSALEHPLIGLSAGGFRSESLDLLRSTPGVELIKSQLLYTEGVLVHNRFPRGAGEARADRTDALPDPPGGNRGKPATFGGRVRLPERDRHPHRDVRRIPAQVCCSSRCPTTSPSG